MTDRVKCLGCGDMFRPNSAKQTHYCCAQCGDRVRNKKKRDRRLALERNMRILNALKIPMGLTLEVDMEKLYNQGFDPEAYTDRINHLLFDGITTTSIGLFGPYMIYNQQNKTFIKFL